MDNIEKNWFLMYEFKIGNAVLVIEKDLNREKFGWRVGIGIQGCKNDTNGAYFHNLEDAVSYIGFVKTKRFSRKKIALYCPKNGKYVQVHTGELSVEKLNQILGVA